MNRLGLTPREGAKAIHTLKNLPHVGEITLMTHLACADDPAAHREINDQLTIFQKYLVLHTYLAL